MWMNSCCMDEWLHECMNKAMDTERLMEGGQEEGMVR